MRRYLIGIVCLGLGLSFALGAASPASAPKIHFLALNLPDKLQESLDRIEADVRSRIKKHLPSADGHIEYLKRDMRHISLVRFKHLSHAEQHVYRAAIKDAVKHVTWGHDHHPSDLSGKVRGARQLHVADDGWITVRIDQSTTLTHFVSEVAKAIHKKRPNAKVDTDAPNHRHISIGKADVSKVPVDKLRRVPEDSSQLDVPASPRRSIGPPVAGDHPAA